MTISDLDSLAILPACMDEIEILHQESGFLIINKPSGLLSVPGRHPDNRDSVLIRMQKLYPTASIVHRLDFDTSGIMVIPLSPLFLSEISKQFQSRQVSKTYNAVVAGIVQQKKGIIDLPIAADMENRPRYKICAESGKKSTTEYRLLSVDEVEQTSRLGLHPITGRSHQLRLHLQALGHPILGDVFYADEATKNRSSRLLLHATDISFHHPEDKKMIKFISPVPF